MQLSLSWTEFEFSFFHSFNQCEQSFDTKNEHDQHMQKSHNIFSCDICTKSFPSLLALDKHKKDHKKLIFMCPTCKKKCYTKDELLQHKETHTMPCPKCGKSFTRKMDRERHIDECHTEQTFPCGICDKTFVRYDVLQVHKMSSEHIARANEKDTSASKRHRKRDATYKINSRSKTTDSEFQRVENFRDSVREGPTHTCICCHKTGYRNNFKQINFDDYKEQVNELKGIFFKDVVDESFKKKLEIPDWAQENDEDAKRHNICTTCDYYITKKKELPAMSYLNGLQLSKEFTPLGELETCLIAKNLVFQKIVRLPSSQWSALQGRTVNVPIDDEDILKTVDKLRTPANAGIIPVRLKRKKEYKTSHRQQ